MKPVQEDEFLGVYSRLNRFSLLMSFSFCPGSKTVATYGCKAITNMLELFSAHI